MSVVTIGVQINGKRIHTFELPDGFDPVWTARNQPEVVAGLNQREVKRVVVIPGKLVNFVCVRLPLT